HPPAGLRARGHRRGRDGRHQQGQGALRRRGRDPPRRHRRADGRDAGPGARREGPRRLADARPQHGYRHDESARAQPCRPPGVGELQAERHALLDAAYGPSTSWLDLQMMCALGEPAYWYRRPDGKPDLDRGASRWEMKTRNRGEDFVANRLAVLCQKVAERTPEAVLAGLRGDDPVDEAGKNAVDSR